MGTRRIGLAGFGGIAERGHLPAWLGLPGVEVVAVADLSAERLDAAQALLPHAQLYRSPLDLIANEDLEVLDICTPPGTHRDLILAACHRGVPSIVCEKPLVLSPADYREIELSRAAVRNRIVSVNNWVHSDMNRQVTAVIHAGEIGQVHEVTVSIGRPDCALGQTGWNPRWRTNPDHAGGGIVLDHGWHQLYLMMGWMGSAPECVQATTRTLDRRHYPVEDEAIIDLSFSGGTGHLELSWVAEERTNVGVIAGSMGTIHTHDDGIVVVTRQSERQIPYTSPLSQSSYHADWFERVFQYNVLARDTAEAERNFHEAGILVGTIDAIYRSGRLGGMPLSLGPQRIEERRVNSSGGAAAG